MILFSTIISAARRRHEWDINAVFKKVQWGDAGYLLDDLGERRQYEEFDECTIFIDMT
jgi:hypothetical protein